MQKVLLFFSILGIVGCAIQSAPEGGPKDETPPDILKATPPNKSTQFSSKEIILEFDEYVELQNFNGQFFSSPPLEKRVTYKLKGKKLYLYLDEELRENTTYTFNFGAAIQDITEKNTQAEFKYVFSTGNRLDSLRISGTVQDAFTGNPEKGIITMLYPGNIEDSVLLKTKPTYYALTDELGNFAIENLALDTFRVVALRDDNLNLIYDPGVEKAAFASEPVVAGTDLNLPLRTYKLATKPELLEAGQKGYGKILVSFTNVANNVQINIGDGEIVPNKREQTFLETAGGGDSIYFWYNARQYPDDMNFLFLDVRADSIQADSVRVLLQKSSPPKLTLSLANSKGFSPLDTAILESPVPILSVDEKFLRVVRDSTELPFEMTQIDPRHIKLYFEKEPGKSFTIYVDSTALTDLFGRMNDSSAVKANVATEADMAIVKMRLSASDSITKIFELLNEKNEVVKRDIFIDSLAFDMNYMIPGSYGIRIIWDINENKRWDGGIYAKKQQPEPVMYYPKPIELRANWELEVEWEIPKPLVTESRGGSTENQ